jgi:glycogen debranching enzyme
MIFDTCFMVHFARYGHQAYPFITGLDNVYARQHENGYICRESDRDNREVSSGFPVNPPLLSWAEWENYQITGDKDRLRAVFLPLVKHYEWWMTYQRRENGLYWTHGLQEADDSPRNALMHAAVSATSYQGLAAQCLAKIAGEIGRQHMQEFFLAQNEELKQLVNRWFWDAAHGIYNDLDKDGQPITELQPGVFCKHVHMFWPLLAGFATPERAAGMVQELKNPASFNRLTGVPSLSADSAGYNNDNGQYWRGAVWPPTQCMVQEGLKQTRHWDDLRELAEKYHRACVADYQHQHTLRENMAPDKILGCGAPDFVGWAGIGPVANLIEYVLGFEIDAPHRIITWTIRQNERHGLTNLQLDDFTVDLIAEAAQDHPPRRITVASGGSFTLRLRAGNHVVEQQITAGTQTIEIQ